MGLATGTPDPVLEEMGEFPGGGPEEYTYQSLVAARVEY